MENFRPLLELLWPDLDFDVLQEEAADAAAKDKSTHDWNSHHGGDHEKKNRQNALALLAFFQSCGVNDLEGIVIFDSKHLAKRSHEWKLFKETALVDRLGLACEYIGIHGVSSLCRLQEKYKNADTQMEIFPTMEENVARYICSNGLGGRAPGAKRLTLVWTTQYLPLRIARRWLEDIFEPGNTKRGWGRERTFFQKNANDANKRERWLRKMPLLLLKLHPLLASELFVSVVVTPTFIRLPSLSCAVVTKKR